MYLFEKNLATVTNCDLAMSSSTVPVIVFPRLRGIGHSYSCLKHLLFKLLQCTLHGAALEDYMETSIDPQCSRSCGVKELLGFPCDFSTARVPLVVLSFLPGVIQMLIVTFPFEMLT